MSRWSAASPCDGSPPRAPERCPHTRVAPRAPAEIPSSMHGRIVQSRFWPGLTSLGLAVLMTSGVAASSLTEGGLAPFAVAGGIALCLGAPLASAERRVGAIPASTRLGGWSARVLPPLADALATFMVAAVVAPLLTRLGGVGHVLAGLGWLMAFVVARRVGGGLAGVLVLIAVSLAMGGALPHALASPWTVLEPRWERVGVWLPGAVVLGLLMAPVGIGQWALGPSLPPGEGRVAWATTGAALWVALATVWRRAAEYEAALGEPTPDVLADLTLGFAALAGASAVVARRGGGRDAITRATLGILATLWFTIAGAGAAPFFLARALPGGMGILLGVTARANRGPLRWSAAVAAIACLGAALFAPIALPDNVAGAGSVALTLVGIFWFVATRTVHP